MSLAPYLAPYFSGNQAWSNANTDFRDYPATPGYPTGYLGLGGATSTPTRVVGQVSPYGCNVTGASGNASDVAGFKAYVQGLGHGWYVVDVVLTLVSGALTGAGVDISGFTDFGFLTPTVDYVGWAFSTVADADGVVQGAGTPGQTYHYRLTGQFLEPASQAIRFRIQAHGTQYGVVTAANSITVQSMAIRPATVGEIAAANQVQGLPVFPLLPGVTPDPEKTPSWSTKVLRASAGNERRTAQWPYPIWNFTLRHEVIRDRPNIDEIHGIWELFNTVQGQFGTFLFLDQNDYLVTREGLGVGDGSNRTWQLNRAIRYWTEPLLCPFGVLVYVDGASVGFTLGVGGVVTLSAPPASGAVVSWSGGFFYPCRFTQDDLTLKAIAAQLWSNDGLKFCSVRSIT